METNAHAMDGGALVLVITNGIFDADFFHIGGGSNHDRSVGLSIATAPAGKQLLVGAECSPGSHEHAPVYAAGGRRHAAGRTRVGDGHWAIGSRRAGSHVHYHGAADAVERA